MANATDLMASVYDKLAEVFNINNNSSNRFLQMAWPAMPLDPANFKNEAGEYDPHLAAETFADLVNIAPTSNQLQFENSGYEIDDLYQIILTSARPHGIAQEEVVGNPLYKLFQDAKFEFDTQKRGSLRDPNLFYRVCKAMPVRWYDEKSTSWTKVKLGESTIKPISTHSPFQQKGGAQLIKKGVWRIKPKKMNFDKITAALTKQVNLDSKIVKPILTLPAIQASSPAIQASSPAIQASGPAIQASGPAIAVPIMLNPSIAGILTAKKLVPKNVFVKPAKLIGQLKKEQIDYKNLSLKMKAVNWKEQQLLHRCLTNSLPTRPASSKTNGYRIEFEYCHVTIDREWLKLALLANRGWYMVGTSSQEYSTGMAANNGGMFPLLPTSFIVIKNLKIKANWSAEDKQNIKDAIGYGPFDVRKKTFKNNLMEVKGMQVIAYISNVTPILPPQNAVAL